MRAGLVFVIAALLIGQGLREWKRGHTGCFQDLVSDLESSDARERVSLAPPDSASRESVPGARVPKAPRDIPVGRIDPNRASAAELIRLPGIGPSLAGRIVADRDLRGAFPTAESLLRVPGIGPKILARIRGYLSFPTANGADSAIGF